MAVKAVRETTVDPAGRGEMVVDWRQQRQQGPGPGSSLRPRVRKARQRSIHLKGWQYARGSA